VDEPNETLGSVELDLSTILCNPEPTICELRIEQTSFGSLTITHDVVPEVSSLAVGRVTGIGFGSGGLMGRGWYYEIEKESFPSHLSAVYRSRLREKDMEWEPFEVPYHMLCSCEPAMPLCLTVLEARRFGAKKKIAVLKCSFEEWRALDRPVAVGSGALKFEDFGFRKMASFHSFLREGTININLIVAIDFTSSNLPAGDPRSLHYKGDPQQPNPYEVCIRAVGEILQPYDADQLFPVFGFGAVYDRAIQHCFPLTFSDEADAVQGIEGIISAYRYALENLEFGDTTKFSKVITKATERARSAYQNHRAYTILLIITDGVLGGDLQDTIDAIVEANDAPLSIVIVGVGSENFDGMKLLDATKSTLIARNRQEATRSVAHFVPFSKFQATPERLASEVLAQVPKQVEKWAEMSGLME
jgi:hypothetical protein